MRKTITVLLSIPFIFANLFTSPFPLHQPQNEGGAWVLVEVIDIDAAEDIESHNKNYEGIYHFEGSYSRGIFSLSTTYVGRSDDYYDPPMVNGEFVAFTAAFSTPPHVIYPNDEITINVLLAAADNHSFFNPSGNVRSQIGKSGQSFRDFTNENGEGSFTSGIRNNYASIDENVTAIAPSGAEGETLELRFYLYNGLKMETRYVYEWKQGDSAEPEIEKPTATIGPTSTIGPTPTVCPANTEIEKFNYLLKLYTTRIPKGIASSGSMNNIHSVVDDDYDDFKCGGYQSKVLNFLNDLKFSKDPCERQLLDNWDYGPIHAYYGGHQAVVLYRKGSDWKSTGIVLDPWQDQAPKTYSINDWAIRFDMGESVFGVPTFIGIGPSEVYREYFDKYPIYGNNYEDNKKEDQYIRFHPEEYTYINSLSPEKKEAFKKMPKPEQKKWLEHMMRGEDKIQKVIAHCPLNLYIMDESGNRSGVSGTEILTDLPNVSFMVLELTDGTNYTEITYPENAGYTLVLEGTDDGQAYVWQGYTLLLGETPPPVQQYSFSVSKGETYQITTDSLGAPLQWEGGSLAPEPVTEISEDFLESLPGLLLPEALDPDNLENEINSNIDTTENESENSTNIWISLLCGLAIFCFLLVVGLVIVFIVLRKKNRGTINT